MDKKVETKMRKKKDERGVTLIAIAVAVIIVIMLVIIITNHFKKKAKVEEGGGQIGVEAEAEYTQTLADGSKLNTSEELKKDKKLNGLELSNIQLKEKGGITTLLADVTNTTNTAVQEKIIKIDILDRQGQIITTIKGPIDGIPAGGTVKLNTSVTADVSNAYNFRISE